MSCGVLFFFVKQKTAYELRISDWSSDVCSSDLLAGLVDVEDRHAVDRRGRVGLGRRVGDVVGADDEGDVGGGEIAIDLVPLEEIVIGHVCLGQQHVHVARHAAGHRVDGVAHRSEEQTSELQSLMRISYAVFCLKKKRKHKYVQVAY